MTHTTRADTWSILFTGRAGLKLIRLGSPCLTWIMLLTLSMSSMPLIPLLHVGCGASLLLIFFSCSTLLGCHCCTHSIHHGILFPFCLHTALHHCTPNCVCRSVQARLCHKHCGHVISLGPYCLSMTSLPFALVAVPGFLLRMLVRHGRTPFFLLPGRAMLTKRLTSFQ